MSEPEPIKLPCDGCFLECVPTKAAMHGGYPCRAELREWAREHRDEPGDEHGYVHERRDER